jgi:hypothetical protein
MNAKAMTTGLFILLSLKYGGIPDKSHDSSSFYKSCAWESSVNGLGYMCVGRKGQACMILLGEEFIGVVDGLIVAIEKEMEDSSRWNPSHMCLGWNPSICSLLDDPVSRVEWWTPSKCCC